MKKILFFAFIFFVGLVKAQQKSKSNTKTKKKVEKEWVNPVKLTKEERSRPYMEDVLKTRDSLTPKEAERRRKNIAIGNPFAKQGYYPKIATLSRGKYLEFHDRDSIVSIGSVKYNTKQKKIVEFIEEDLSNPDRQPLGDTHGMWMSPDPLSEEFSSWSPYNYAFQNPIRNVDPTGMAADDVIIKGNKSQEALQQLQASVQGQLNLSMDSNGKVTATQVEGSNLSQGSSELLSATTDSSVIVNVSATDNDFTSGGEGPLLGFFGGNKSSNSPVDGSLAGSSGQKTVTNQEVNTDALGNLSKANGNPGQAILHEVTESYRGARITQADGNTGVRSTANNDDASNSSSVYRRAHDGAVNQGGNINEHFYNAQGQEVYRGDSNFQPVKLIYNTNNDTTVFHTVPKQR